METRLRQGAALTILSAVLSAVLLAAPALEAAEVTVPRGTAVELVVDTPFDTETAKPGARFATHALRAVFVDGQLVIPRDALVTGEVKHVQSAKAGAKSGVLAIKFETLDTGGRKHDIEGALTSVMAEQRRRIVEQRGKLTTGQRIDVVLIGTGSEPTGRADTLVGTSGENREDLAEEWGKSGLGPATVFVGAGTQLAMQLEKDIALPVIGRVRPGANDRNIVTAEAGVRALQEALRAKGLYSGEATGRLDDATRSAIAIYQLDRGERIATGDPDADVLAALGITASGK